MKCERTFSCVSPFGLPDMGWRSLRNLYSGWAPAPLTSMWSNLQRHRHDTIQIRYIQGAIGKKRQVGRGADSAVDVEVVKPAAGSPGVGPPGVGYRSRPLLAECNCRYGCRYEWGKGGGRGVCAGAVDRDAVKHATRQRSSRTATRRLDQHQHTAHGRHTCFEPSRLVPMVLEAVAVSPSGHGTPGFCALCNTGSHRTRATHGPCAACSRTRGVPPHPIHTHQATRCPMRGRCGSSSLCCVQPTPYYFSCTGFCVLSGVLCCVSCPCRTTMHGTAAREGANGSSPLRRPRKVSPSLTPYLP